jgi:GntR family transcriptional regulator
MSPALPPSPVSITFAVSTASSTPIYLQLVEQVVRMVASGQLAPESTLPSVREVAVSLAINPMTVSKAYSQLEMQGVLARRRGMGMVVAAGTGSRHAKADRLELLRPTLAHAALEAEQLNISPADAVALFERILKGKK